uniref:LAGLDADG endonuclease n=1 Tax=Chlamydomonas subcaudata TaxID=163303 RepID=U5I315_CHLSU|nr:LAGLDADG endonuclease [Chlamydomonas subcaudata]
MKVLPREELIYLAGFIDGDGAIMAQIVRRRDYTFQFQLKLSVQLTQKTSRIHFLQNIKESLGVGYVRRRGEISQVSDYVVTEPQNVYSLLKAVQPFLKLKKKQANLVMHIIELLPRSKDSLPKFYELCVKADHVAELNDSKSRTVTSEAVKAMHGDKVNPLSPP